MAGFIQAMLGGSPRRESPLILREDFCGSAGVARAWAALNPHHRAIAVDLDQSALAKAGRMSGVRLVNADVRQCAAKAHAISATNFPLGYFHSRAELARYLRATRSRLRARGVFIADTYGGPSAFDLGVTTQTVRLGDATRPAASLVKHWEQREADPISGMVTDVLHFEVRIGRRVVKRFRDAFVYRWRLWPVAELREAMLEAGFKSVEVYSRLVDAIDHEGRVHVRPAEPDDLRDDHVAWLVARTR